MKSLNQLLLEFDFEQNFKDDDFYVGKSNFYPFELINKWPNWEKKFLNLSSVVNKKMTKNIESGT